MTTPVNTMWDPGKGDVQNPVFNSMTVVSSFVVSSGGTATIAGTLVTSGGIQTTPINRPLLLTTARTDAGVSVTGTATGGAFGVARTAGTSLVLNAETASSGTKTDKAFFEVDLPGGYISGTPLPVVVNAIVNGGGTFTGSTTVMTVTGYSESQSGTEAALTTTVSGSGATSTTVTSAATNYTFVISGGSALVPGARIGIGVSMTVVNTVGTNTGAINGAYIVA